MVTKTAKKAMVRGVAEGLTVDIHKMDNIRIICVNKAQPRRRPRRQNKGKRMRSISGDQAHLKLYGVLTREKSPMAA